MSLVQAVVSAGLSEIGRRRIFGTPLVVLVALIYLFHAEELCAISIVCSHSRFW